jgi:hypothetical protein
MKTLSVRFRFVVIGIIAIVAVVSCCYFPPILDTRAYATVEIGSELRGKGTYVKWKNKHDFDKALAQVRANNGKICVCVLESSNNTPYRHELNNDCPNYHCPSENIRTVKVTKSKAADNIAAGESAANDPNAMHRVQSPDPRDIIKVLGALKQ